MNSPTTRFLGRLGSVVVTLALTFWAGLDPAEQTAITAAVYGLINYATPLNSQVGAFKTEDRS